MEKRSNIFSIAVLVCVSTFLRTLVEAGPIRYYATKYDHLDVEQILNNRRMVNYYAQCLLGKGPCPPQGLEFKRILPEALETNCLRCTEKQKAVTYRTIKRLKKEYPKIWVELSAKWDPMDVYVKKFEETYKNAPLNPPPISPSSENEINIDDRFGVIENKKPSTTTTTTRKPTTTTRRITTTTTTRKPTQTTNFNIYHNKVSPLQHLVSSIIGELIEFKVAILNNFLTQGHHLNNHNYHH